MTAAFNHENWTKRSAYGGRLGHFVMIVLNPNDELPGPVAPCHTFVNSGRSSQRCREVQRWDKGLQGPKPPGVLKGKNQERKESLEKFKLLEKNGNFI